MRLVYLLSIFVVLLVSVVIPSPVTAQEPITKAAAWTLPTLAGTDTLRLEGYRPVVRFDLIIPPGWQPSSFSRTGQLVLDYRISELAIAGGATLTVRLNGEAVSFIAFKEAGATVALDRNAGSLSFDLPTALLQIGRNTLQLAAFLPLEEDEDCIVPNHPARWLEIESDSRINLSLEPTEGPLNLSDFPAQFEIIGTLEGTQITFVIPEEPDDQELNALSAVAFAMAREMSTQPAWSVTTATDFDTAETAGPVVLIGAAGQNPHVDSLAPAEGEAGWLRLARADWSASEPVLAIGGVDGQAVLRAAKALLDPLAVLQMAGEIATVDELPTVEPDPLPEVFSLADLGYDDRTARGLGEQSLIYAFDVPFAWAPRDGRLELNFVHSAIVDPQIATLTVFMNGRYVTDIRLDVPETASNSIETTIPQSLLRPGRNFLRLTFNFSTPIQLCEGGPPAEPWATVRPDSALSLPHGNRGGRLTLDDFPYLLSSEVDLADLAIVLPAQRTTEDLTAALDLVRVWGGSDSEVAPRWMAAEEVNEEETRRSHLIILGDFPRQPALQDLNPHLPLPFNTPSGELWSSYGIRIPTNRPDLGTVQALRSPWAENRAILVVAGVNPKGYDRALRLLTEPQLQAALDGQLAVVAGDDEVQALEIYTRTIPDLGAVPAVGAADRSLRGLFGSDSPWPAIILVAAALVIFAAVSTIGLRWYGRRQAAQSGGH